MDTTAGSFSRRDVRVLSVVCAGHFFSHFYIITLPPLFFAINHDLGISFVLLGALMSIRSGVGGFMQIPAGILVDRIGAKPVILGGMLLQGSACLLSGFATNYLILVLCSVGIALGSSVFHPTDYAILNASIDQKYTGRVFALHSFIGQVGTAVSPIVVGTLAVTFNWRVAQIAVGLIGFPVVLALMTQWSAMRDDIVPTKKKKASEAGPAVRRTAWEEIQTFLSKPMLIMFLFFSMTSIQSNGIQSFFVSGLSAVHSGTSIAAGSAALTAYLSLLAVGVLGGGWVVDMFGRQDVTAAVAFAISTVIMLLIAFFDIGYVGLVLIMGISGLMQGAIRPARDMMVRALVPKAAMGRAFGFVSSGQAIGGACAPIAFGWFIDIGRADVIFYALALFTGLCVLASIVPKEVAHVKSM
ncbi:MAG TPA: MFS transporter [Alphaproteobacteria bacterium]|nr:MFS transporter [Alphaproteobacteria bacterium]